MKKEYSKFLIILIIALFLEVIVFNITSYRMLFGGYEKQEYTDFEFLYYADEQALLKIDNINKKVGTVKIELSKEVNFAQYSVYYSDETTDETVYLASKKYLGASEKSKYMPTYLSGNTKNLIVDVDQTYYDKGYLEKIVINEKIPFEFNVIRFLIVVGALTLGYFYKNSKVFNSKYSEKNLKQEMILLVVISVFIILATYINIFSEKHEIYGTGWLAGFSTDEGVYNKEFVDAILDGQLYLQEDPSEEFKNLKNPYDNITRASQVGRDIDYKWDTAYYNGHQYIYFGILPILITFLPYFLLTKRYLKITVVVLLFSILIFILLKEILIKLVKRYFKDIPFKNVFLFLITLCSGTLILYANGMARVYEVVIIVGLYFVLQGIYFILNSMNLEKNKYLNIFLGAVCLSLAVASRPTMLIASILILPYLTDLLIKNIKQFKTNKKNLFKLVFAVGIPYLTVGILLMIYNYARFDNPFEFGAKYQLTIANMEALGSRFFAIPVGIVCNFFNIPTFIADFPFLLNNRNIISFYGFYYVEQFLGGLFFIAPICFMTFFVRKANKKSENKELKTIINALLIVGVILAVISVMMAGSNQRYLIDYAWMFIFSGILIFSVIYNALKAEESKKILQYILLIVTIYTFIMAILCGIVSEGNYMESFSKEEFYKLKYSICFWE